MGGKEEKIELEGEALEAFRSTGTAEMDRLMKLNFSEAEAERLGRLVRVQVLVAGGASRLTAERIVAIERGEAEPGRARRHPQSRR
jgi:hypothetical protein